jgi:FixJ family two-component response regulator
MARAGRATATAFDPEMELYMDAMGTAYCQARSAAISLATPIVFVVDDDTSVRKSLERLIRSTSWEPQTFGSAEEFLARPRAHVPSCLILDVNLPDLNGLDLQERIAADRVDLPVIFITGQGDVPMSVKAMKAGAIEFLIKPFDEDALLTAIAEAIDRSEVAMGTEAEIRGLRERYDRLSRREREVMDLVVRGKPNKQVGRDLQISEITVKAHRGRMMNKMQAGSLPDLVKMASRLHPESQRRNASLY